jgi:hypothetical protein
VKRTRLAVTAALAIGTPSLAGGQVGHPPEASPYRDVRAKHVLSVTAGYLAGSSGSAGVGATDGPIFGARFDLHVSGPAEITFGLELADLNRLVLDPTKSAATRVKGTASQSVILGEVGLVMRLTGEKSWRGLVPYFGGALGLAVGSSVAQDSSGFTFGTKFQVSPRLGVRWFLSNRINLRIEGRDVLWRLSYPDLFFEAPVEAEDDPPILDPTTMDETEWTHHPTLTFTLGYAIRM